MLGSHGYMSRLYDLCFEEECSQDSRNMIVHQVLLEVIDRFELSELEFIPLAFDCYNCDRFITLP